MILPPGATIGIIGGGQLGRMLAMAAARLGFKTCILEPGKDCPAAQVANQHLDFAYNDTEGLGRLAEISDVITYEFENVPLSAAHFIEQSATLHPPSLALEMSQDRLVEKQFLAECGANTAGFADIASAVELEQALDRFGGRAILKTRRLGYDGKGQIFFNGSTAIDASAIAQVDNVPCILEQLVDFKCEISIILARGQDGSIAAFDPAENVHRDGILRTSTVPADVSSKTRIEAVNIAENIARNLNYIGIIGVEFFVLEDGSLLVNEFAPRVHNSGHWTEAACAISQFEQHIRAIAGWPLGSTERHSDCVMENIIGNEVEGYENRTSDMAEHLHLYGKSEVRTGRKMGHITRLMPRAS